jgi:pyridoxamine 5'-phosphate oxidase-like protein
MDPIGRAVATVLDLPSDVHAVLAGFVTCEVATLGRDETPLAWPAVPLLLPERGQVLLTTTIGFPAKAANIRRDPRVSLLYSDPTGSGLESPPSVLVQGTATVSDSVVTWNDDLGRHWRRVRAVQPSSRLFSSPAVRWFLDWYFMRLLIHVSVRRVSWWPGGDTSRPPTVWEVSGA